MDRWSHSDQCMHSRRSHLDVQLHPLESQRIPGSRSLGRVAGLPSRKVHDLELRDSWRSNLHPVSRRHWHGDEFGGATRIAIGAKPILLETAPLP